MKEIWKPVVGYEGIYEISNLARVKSLNYNHTGKSHILKPTSKTRMGYTKVHLRYKNDKHTVLHQLVAQAFVPNPNNKPFVLHKKALSDGGTNYADNLYWGDQSDNMRDKVRDGHFKNPRKGKFGKDNPTSYQVAQYTKKGEFVAQYESIVDASYKTGIKHCSISFVVRGDKYRKTAGGYIWKRIYNE